MMTALLLMLAIPSARSQAGSLCNASLQDAVQQCPSTHSHCYTAAAQCFTTLSDIQDNNLPQVGNSFYALNVMQFFAKELLSNNCREVPQPYMENVSTDCFGPCLGKVYLCTLDAECTSCLSTTGSSANCDSTAMADVMSTCGCPHAYEVDNVLVIATSIIGAISVVGCLLVLVVIWAHNKDRRSLRDRILVGFFVANMIFSLANTIPYNLVRINAESCSSLDDQSPQFRCFAQGMWMCGKYMIGMFEVFILIASIVALYTGSNMIPFVYEVLAHAVCVSIGVIVWIVFVVECNNDIDNESGLLQTVSGSNTLNQDVYNYNTYVMLFIRTWISFVVLAMILWTGLRLYLRHLLKEWKNVFEEKSNMLILTPKDSKPDIGQANARILLQKKREGYLEIAAPLEPFVAVFILFSIPAIVMATAYCKKSTNFYAGQKVSCNQICELILSFRSFSSVLVYFLDLQSRKQLLDFRTLLLKLLRRIRDLWRWIVGRIGSSYRISFNDRVDVKNVEPDSTDNKLDYSDDENDYSGVAYELMLDS